MYRHKRGIFSSNKSISQYVTLVTFISVKYDDITTTNILLFVLESIYQNLAPINSINIQIGTKSQSISLLLYVQCVRITNSLNGNDLLRALFWWQAVKGRQGGLNASIHVLYVCVSPSPDNTQTFTPYELKLRVSQRCFFFCTSVCIKLNFTCVCLPSPSHSLLKEHWSWVGPVSSLCIVRKPGAKAQMVSKYLKKTGCS